MREIVVAPRPKRCENRQSETGHLNRFVDGAAADREELALRAKAGFVEEFNEEQEKKETQGVLLSARKVAERLYKA